MAGTIEMAAAAFTKAPDELIEFEVIVGLEGYGGRSSGAADVPTSVYLLISKHLVVDSRLSSICVRYAH